MMTKAVDIFAIRHGETDWNADGRLQGQTDIPLNEKGVAQAELMACGLQDLSLDAVYSSDLLRASQTAEKLTQTLGIGLQKHAGLRERHFGSFQGMTFAQVEATYPTEAKCWRDRTPDFIPGGSREEGESLQAFSDRVLQTLDAIALEYQGQKIAIVTHGGVLDVIYRAATKTPIQAPRTWALGNTSVSHLRWSSQGIELITWSDMSHLERHQSSAMAAIEPSGEF